MNRKTSSVPMRKAESSLFNASGLTWTNVDSPEIKSQTKVSISKFVKVLPFSSVDFSPLPPCILSSQG